MKRYSLVISCLALSLASCAHPFVPLTVYTRTENYNLEHARWLNAHCDLLGLNRGEISIDLGNYMQTVGEERQVFIDGSSLLQETSMIYACEEPIPWPREDGDFVRANYKNGMESGASYATRCAGIYGERAKATFEVVEAGSGAAPTAESYARYRVTPVVVIPSDKQAEAEEWGVTAGKRRSWVTANHIPCSNFRDALLKLKVGGKAHVSALTGKKGMMSEVKAGDMFEWDVELLELGTVDLLLKEVGLTRMP